MLQKGAIKLFVIVPFVLSILTFILSVGAFIYLIIQDYIGFNQDSYSMAVCSSLYLNVKYAYFKQMLTFQFVAALLSVGLSCGSLVIHVMLLIAYRSLQNDDQVMQQYTVRKLIALVVLYLADLLMVQLILSDNITFLLQSLLQRNSCQSVTYLSFLILVFISALNFILHLVIIVFLIVLNVKYSEMQQNNTPHLNHFQLIGKHNSNQTGRQLKNNLLNETNQDNGNIYNNQNNEANNNKKMQVQMTKIKKNDGIGNKKTIFNIKDNEQLDEQQKDDYQNRRQQSQENYNWPAEPKKSPSQNQNYLYVKENFHMKNPNFDDLHQIKLKSSVINISNIQNLKQQQSEKQAMITHHNQSTLQKQNSLLKVHKNTNNHNKQESIQNSDSIFLIKPIQNDSFNYFKQSQIFLNMAPNSAQKSTMEQKKNFQSVDQQGRYFYVQKSKIKIKNSSKIKLKAQKEPTIEDNQNLDIHSLSAYKRKQTFIKPKRTPKTNKWIIKPNDEIGLQQSIYENDQSQPYSDNDDQDTSSYESSSQISHQSSNEQQQQYERKGEQLNNQLKKQQASNILSLNIEQQSKILSEKQIKKQNKKKDKSVQKLFLHFQPKKQQEVKLRLFDIQEYVSIDSYKSVLNGKQTQGIQQVESHREKMNVLEKVKNDERYLIRSKDPNSAQGKIMRTIKTKFSGF